MVESFYLYWVELVKGKVEILGEILEKVEM